MRLKVENFLNSLVVIIFKLFGFKIVHFLHIGKTGGTSIKSVFLEKNTIFKKYRICKKYVFVMHKHKFYLEHVKENELAFFVIRDPIERYVSGFNSRLRQGRPRNFNPWKPKEKEVFEEFQTPNSLAEGLTHENPEKRMRAEKGMAAILHVRNSVWEWFANEDYFLKSRSKILFILRQANLKQDFLLFKQKIGIDIGDLPDDPILSHKSPEGLDKHLSESAYSNLKNWYRRDYEFMDMIKKQGLVD